MRRLIALSVIALISVVVRGAAPSTQPVYDVSADAAKQIQTAERVAGYEHQRVLLDVGGNWCHWCRLLHGVFTDDPKVATLLRSEYQVVYVDIGDDGAKNNTPLLAKYGIKPQGYPYLAILGPDDKLVTQQETGALEDGPKHDPQKVLAFLDKWKVTPPSAQSALSDAMNQAASQGKRVFLRFGAPWCGWCHKLDDVLYQPAVADAIEADYVVVKIDTQRMAGADAVVKKYQTSGGIPWYAVLTADGKTVVNSDLPPGNNIGFPTEPAEVDHIVHMFADGHQHMSDGQIATIRSALEEAARKVKQAH